MGMQSEPTQQSPLDQNLNVWYLKMKVKSILLLLLEKGHRFPSLPAGSSHAGALISSVTYQKKNDITFHVAECDGRECKWDVYCVSPFQQWLTDNQAHCPGCVEECWGCLWWLRRAGTHHSWKINAVSFLSATVFLSAFLCLSLAVYHTIGDRQDTLEKKHLHAFFLLHVN